MEEFVYFEEFSEIFETTRRKRQKLGEVEAYNTRMKEHREHDG
jgi:hypothetical protein